MTNGIKVGDEVIHLDNRAKVTLVGKEIIYVYHSGWTWSTNEDHVRLVKKHKIAPNENKDLD